MFDLLFNLKDEQTIVFCSSPARVRYLSKRYAQYLAAKMENGQINVPLIEWIEENVHRQWCLTDCLKKRMGIHDGALPRHITSSIISYFNEGVLNTLFCTTTIIEGVNTSAKNIIYFDSTKGNQIKIDYFDYSNIKGRAGRMMVHFVAINKLKARIPESLNDESLLDYIQTNHLVERSGLIEYERCFFE